MKLFDIIAFLIIAKLEKYARKSVYHQNIIWERVMVSNYSGIIVLFKCEKVKTNILLGRVNRQFW